MIWRARRLCRMIWRRFRCINWLNINRLNMDRVRYRDGLVTRPMNRIIGPERIT
jgi:hypothetical protein